MPPRAKKTDPQIITLPARKVAAVHTTGDPTAVAPAALNALFGSVYTLKFARKKEDPAQDFKVECPRARWLNAHLVSRDQWEAVWAIPLPDDVKKLPQKDPAMEVTVEKWAYGTVAQILHLGPYAEEGPTVSRLHEFIAESGYEIAGPHEEEYVTKPDARQMQTIIRYQVKKKK